MYSFLINRNNMLCYIVLMFCHDGCFQRLCLIVCSWPGTESAGGRAGVLWHLPRSRSQFLLKKPIGASMQSLTVKASTPGYLPKAAARTEKLEQMVESLLAKRWLPRAFVPAHTFPPGNHQASARGNWQFACVFSDREQRLDGCCNMGWCAQKLEHKQKGAHHPCSGGQRERAEARTSHFWGHFFLAVGGRKACKSQTCPPQFEKRETIQDFAKAVLQVAQMKLLPVGPEIWQHERRPQVCGVPGGWQSRGCEQKNVARPWQGFLGTGSRPRRRMSRRSVRVTLSRLWQRLLNCCTRSRWCSLSKLSQTLRRRRPCTCSPCNALSLGPRLQHPCEPCLVDRNLDTATNPQIWPNYSWLQS